MELQSLAEKYSPTLRKYWLPIVLGVIGLMLFAYGLIGLLPHNSKNSEFQDLSNETPKNISEEKIFVDIEGAVISPGAYELPKDSRIKDLLVKAGGLSQNADRDWFAKNVNLVLKLIDGGKLYIPKTGESYSAISQSQNVMGASTNTSGLVNINSASESELDALSGIGPVTAGKIINNRPYLNINDLLSKKAVSNSVFQKIKDKITI